MVKRTRKVHGSYSVKGKKYSQLIGSRAQVWHRTAYKTSGGLTRDHLMMNKNGRIVSKKKHTRAKREKRLEKHGYFAKKGVFGAVTRDSKGKSRKATRRRRRR
jgi:hypothetical protein